MDNIAISSKEQVVCTVANRLVITLQYCMKLYDNTTLAFSREIQFNKALIFAWQNYCVIVTDMDELGGGMGGRR